MRNIAEEILMGVDSSEKLIHTEEYLGAEYDEGLQHWKYIKKYRNSKGKWTYVYADKNTHNNIEKKDYERQRDAKAASQFNAHAAFYMDHLKPGVGGSSSQSHIPHEIKTGLLGYKLYSKRAEEKNKQYDYLIEANSIKSAANRSIKELKTTYKDIIKRGSNFIDSILSKFK